MASRAFILFSFCSPPLRFLRKVGREGKVAAAVVVVLGGGGGERKILIRDLGWHVASSKLDELLKMIPVDGTLRFVSLLLHTWNH